MFRLGWPEDQVSPYLDWFRGHYKTAELSGTLNIERTDGLYRQRQEL